MRILFTSDLHGYEPAFVRFTHTLGEGRFDCGVLAGDLMTHFTPDELQALLSEHGLSEDDLLDELRSPDDHEASNVRLDRIVQEAVERRAQELQALLASAGVPVFFIMGNDDGIIADGCEWESTGMVQSMNQRLAEHGGWRFVGYQFTSPFVGGRFERPEHEQEHDLQALESLVDERTILVTHGPPRGILDANSYGSIALRRFVDRTRPYLHLFGHIHQSAGIRWPFVNGAFPATRSFVSIDLEQRHASFTPALESSGGHR